MLPPQNAPVSLALPGTLLIPLSKAHNYPIAMRHREIPVLYFHPLADAFAARVAIV